VQVVLLLVVAVSLLALLLVPHGTGGSAVALFCLTLVPVFLFGSVVVGLLYFRPAVDVSVYPAPARTALFQRPPPTFQS
jgi:hypothetical protein